MCVLTFASLAACGGGGGGGGSVGSSPGDGSPVTPQPTPNPSTVPPEAGLAISSHTTAQRNTRYDVTAAAGVVDLTLPQFIVPGDFVSIRGLAGSRWRLVPNPSPGTTARSDSMPQAVVTDTLPGNVVPGRVWTARALPAAPVAVASNEPGDTLAAVTGLGAIEVSTDAGASWARSNSPPGQNWVSIVARTPPYPMSMAVSQSLIAGAAGGGLFRSSDRGSSWTQLVSTDPNVNLINRDWRSVTADQGAQTIAAVIFNGPIYRFGRSANAISPIWQAGTLVGSTAPLIRPWRGIASAATAGVMAAVTEAGEVFVSETGGQTWQLRNVTVGGNAIAAQRGQWSQVAISADGGTLAVAGEHDSGLFLSRDRGASWTHARTPVGDYTAIAMSADASVIGATLANARNAEFGSVQISRDGGATFDRTPTIPEGNNNWRALAISADGHQYLASSGSRIYTSLGNRTSIGSSGAIEGGANDFVEVEFLGNARFKVRQFQGGPFTIR